MSRPLPPAGVGPDEALPGRAAQGLRPNGDADDLTAGLTAVPVGGVDLDDRDDGRQLEAAAVSPRAATCLGRVRSGEFDRGLAMLDETMVGTLSIDLSPLVRGALLCHGISLCQQVGDSKRAGWWIEAGDRATSACGLNFSGECHMHRAEVLKSQGSLTRAEAEALRSAQGHHEDAVPLLRSGISQWLEIGAPNEAASGGKEGTPGQGHRMGCRVPDLRRAS